MQVFKVKLASSCLRGPLLQPYCTRMTISTTIASNLTKCV